MIKIIINKDYFEITNIFCIFKNIKIYYYGNDERIIYEVSGRNAWTG